ncbi:MAG: VanZ family protein [Planctomycetota bacterium]
MSRWDPARHRRPLRIAFVAYAIVLFIATHKPGVAVPLAAGIRLDLLVHVAAFGLWTLLLGLSGFIGPVRRVRALGVLAVVGVLYAWVDEATQAIPGLNRVFDLSDLVANTVGAVAGAVAAHALARITAADVQPGSDSDPEPHSEPAG